MPEVSVIIPVYNKAKYVGETIESVLSQTSKDFEIVVVDDGSTDESPDILKKYVKNKRIVVYRQENRGCPAALNKGIGLSKGNFICWLSADDAWYENKLELQLREFENDPRLYLIYTDTDHIDENGNVVVKHIRSADEDVPLAVRVTSINGSSVMFKRCCIGRIGLFDEELRCSNDTDMWHKIGRRFKMKRIPLPLIRSRQEGDRLSNNQEMMIKYYSFCLVKNNLPLELGLIRRLSKDPKLIELIFLEGKRYLQKMKRNYYLYRMRTFLFAGGWYYFLLYVLPLLNKRYELFKKDVLGVNTLRELSKGISIKKLSRRRRNAKHKQVLFLYPRNPIATFEDIDRKILGKNFIMRSLCIPDGKDKKRQLRLSWEILWSDVVVSWFADWHSYYAVRIANFLKKKSIIITGGYDTSAIPEIGYGIAANRPHHLHMVQDVLRMSNVLIVNSLFAKRELLHNFDVDEGKISAIYHGFQIDSLDKSNKKVRKENIVLTVAFISKVNLLLKGLKTFVQSARYLPHMRFILVGPNMDESILELKEIALPNVEFLGGLYGKDLQNIYKKAKVYVQASMCESFGCALAEAMLCECVPVVTREGALPEVVGECGFYVPANDPKEIALAIDKASSNLFLGKQARNRIVERFQLKKREETLRDLINNMTLN